MPIFKNNSTDHVVKIRGYINKTMMILLLHLATAIIAAGQPKQLHLTQQQCFDQDNLKS